MSGLYDYDIARQIAVTDPPFNALIMAAILRADSRNSAVLQHAFPTLHAETTSRHNAPGGRLDSDRA